MSALLSAILYLGIGVIAFVVFALIQMLLTNHIRTDGLLETAERPGGVSTDKLMTLIATLITAIALLGAWLTDLRKVPDLNSWLVASLGASWLFPLGRKGIQLLLKLRTRS